MSEQWFLLTDHPNYAISTRGRFKRIAPGGGAKVGRILKLTKTNGRLYVHFWSQNHCRTYYVHRLIARLHHGECPPGQQVNHIDGNPLHNNPKNLEYVTPSENLKHAYRIGLRKRGNPWLLGAYHWNAKLSPSNVKFIRSHYKRYSHGPYSATGLGKQFGVERHQILAIMRRENWKSVD